MKKYEDFDPTPHALYAQAVLTAFVKTYDGNFPKLFVHDNQLLAAIEMGLPLQVCVDSDLRPMEWYVECNGKRFGSLGA